MAFGQTTSYQTTGAKLYVSGYTFGLQSATNVDSIDRTDNRVYVYGANVRVKVTGPSGGYFSGFNVYGAYSLPQGSTREERNYLANGGSTGQEWGSEEKNFNFTVGANDTGTTTNNGAAFASDGMSWAGGQTIDIPNLGTPDGTTYFVSSTTNSIVARNNVTTWGAYGTANLNRIYYSSTDTVPDTNDSYVNVSDNVDKTITGLAHNTKYYFTGYQSNGGGKAAYSNTVSGVTNSEVYEAGTVDIQAVSYSVTDAKAYAGHYTNNNKIQYRKKGDTTWIDSDTVQGDTFSITITGLLPSTTYERRFVNTTTAGTTTNGIYEFTTLPAAKLVMPNGTVLNAIPRVVHPNGTVKMVKVKHL